MMQTGLRYRRQRTIAEVRPEGGRFRITLDGQEHEVSCERLDAGTILLTMDGTRHRVDLARLGAQRWIAIDGEVFRIDPESASAGRHDIANVAVPELVAPMPGRILKVEVQAGDRVEPGDTLVVLEAMKMENRLVAEAAGHVAEVRVSPGDTVNGGAVLLVLAFGPAES